MLDSKDINKYVEGLGSSSKKASEVLASISTKDKNSAIGFIADEINIRKKEILKANSQDLLEASKKGISDSLVDRLELNDERIDTILLGLSRIKQLPDPVGEITTLPPTPSGIRVSQIRVPLGVIGIIYESRPNVTVDASALCLKAGNACILKGGAESIKSNIELMKCIKEGLSKADIPEDSINLIETVNRKAVNYLLSLEDHIDLIIPRGGKSLVEIINKTTNISVLKHLEGICHVFVDKEADLVKARSIAFNAKTYRYGICGSMETLLLHETIANQFLPEISLKFQEKGVELRGCKKTSQIVDVKRASQEDWSTEYLGPILSIRVVKSIDSAIDHINAFGSSHSDSIVTEDKGRAKHFINKVDSSSVMHNLPTCWADGFEYGLGAEIGISTDKLHARGPVALKGLTCQKYIVEGDAELRGVK